ncbi:MAG: hypothetical protein E7294_09095 [Lachnospiraceae bacterium]|nr:hypothetical protein [Lachnospiraceae bacterium]
MKILALYLPQFHEVKENSEWWGENFTEWTSVKSAKPLYENHAQPVLPLNGYYYNLLDHSTMVWQEKLIKRSGLDGICIYHYWFKEGKQILEKPAENLLRWKDIDINFCFSWANETWARTWSGLSERNTWASLFETTTNSENGILLEQKYGNEKEWERHFEYLLPFFRDERYIKIGNKPVMEFHKLKDISCFENMIEMWNDLAYKNGFEGIFAIGNQPRLSQEKSLQMKYICQPGIAMQQVRCDYINGIKCFDYDDVWRNILSEDFQKGSVGAFVNYDDTPRHGNNGSVIINASSEKMKIYLSKLIERNEQSGREIMFVNAWNEWGEGMHLEPDEENRYAYLDAISDAIYKKGNDEKIFSPRLLGLDEYKQLEQDLEKERLLRDLLDKWIQILKSPNRFRNYVKDLGIIGVYGYGILGKHIVDELLMSGCDVRCVIDRRNIQECPVPIFKLDNELPELNTMIVTATYEYGFIYEMIRRKNKKIRILSIEYIIKELL